MSEELLPCPFCGPGNSVVTLYIDDDFTFPFWKVGCGRCGSHSGTHKDKQVVVYTWNKRAPYPADVRDGNWMDKMGACRVCDGEIPYGHSENCDIWKMEKKEAELRKLISVELENDQDLARQLISILDQK